MKAIRVHDWGGPEVLLLEEVPTPAAGPGQVVVRIEAIGVNFIDIHQRTGQYKTPLPFTPGQEAAGALGAEDDR
jgi:NADPH:quinone reductase